MTDPANWIDYLNQGALATMLCGLVIGIVYSVKRLIGEPSGIFTQWAKSNTEQNVETVRLVGKMLMVQEVQSELSRKLQVNFEEMATQMQALRQWHEDETQPSSAYKLLVAAREAMDAIECILEANGIKCASEFKSVKARLK